MSPPELSIIVPAYNPGSQLALTLGALAAQELPGACGMEIIVVDDGSTEPGISQLVLPDVARVLRLPTNQGRAAARNAGAAEARAALLLFLDCDCMPASPQFLASHLAVIASGAVGSCGPIEAKGDRFWACYQQKSRLAEGTLVPLGRFSAANFCIRREGFDAVGGFDAAYRGYGFEDRDFYARLQATDRQCISASRACVLHEDQLTLRQVWNKMHEGAAGNAGRFARQHPEHYRPTRYGRLDAREHPALRLPARLLGALLRPTLDLGQSVLDQGWLPFALRRRMAQGYLAAAFLCGSASGSSSSV